MQSGEMELNMEKLKVVVVTENIDYRLTIKNLLDSEDIAVAAFTNCDKSAIPKIISLCPDIVICTYDEKNSCVFEISQSIYLSIHGCSIILLSNDVKLEIVTKAMQNGIHLVLPINIDKKEMLNNIRQANIIEKQRSVDGVKSTGNKSKVIAFFGGKGGTGKTTVAVNIAVTLSQMNKKVIIVDCDLQFGDVNLLFDLEPKDTIAELAQESNSLSIDIIKGFTMLHSTGVSVLCAPKSPEYAEYVTGKHIEDIINTLRPYYEYIIIDLSPSFNDISIAAVENCDQVYLVSGLDISALRNAKICTNILDSLQQKDKVAVIINKASESVIKAKDYENILGLKVVGSISEDTKIALKSLNKGVPIVLSQPRCQITKSIKAICDKILNS
jgi:pilus assembly protein CpaE